MKGNENKNALKIIVEGLIQEAYELLSETLSATKEADDKAKQQGASWTYRHRLHVLLEAAEETRKGLPEVVVDPWFLAELKATLDIVRRWQVKPSWREIEPSLKDPSHFKHTILKLHVAEHLEGGGHRVEIVPRGQNASPDLIVYAIGGTQDPVYIECYQPNALCDRPSDISAKEAKSIIEKSMKKAKRQLDNKTPGILAICGYNQSRNNLENLRHAIESRLQKTSRPNLVGILLMMLGVMLHKNKDNISFTSIRSANFIHNPSYFGRVGIEAKVPDDDPQLIKEPLIDISTDDLTSGDINLVISLASAGNVSPTPVKNVRRKITRQRKLDIIEKPKQSSRVVVHGVSNKVPPLFEGTGNIDCLCGQCEAILAKHVWNQSISNIVVECPICQSYNEFSPLPDSSDYNRILLTKGNYNFSEAIKLIRGVCVEGQ